MLPRLQSLLLTSVCGTSPCCCHLGWMDIPDRQRTSYRAFFKPDLHHVFISGRGLVRALYLRLAGAWISYQSGSELRLSFLDTIHFSESKKNRIDVKFVRMMKRTRTGMVEHDIDSTTLFSAAQPYPAFCSCPSMPVLESQTSSLEAKRKGGYRARHVRDA
ncbi:hypothetical protein LshimejAT787_1500650 [Lyophyllum shimeji]|uniref:Secreted protein n=1 Tax=Lyophyllum shimeji TaxID=47721 RepID=A0A9P3PYD5_LYOSH|nr:hypothetical protein LshimejAT787_1500650 [Lyophyllum shimeji]